MQSTIVVTSTKEISQTADKFVEGTVLLCNSAPSGYLYAIGQIAFKPKHYSFDDTDYVIQHDVTNGLRVYSSEDLFYKEATFVQARKGITITIEAL